MGTILAIDPGNIQSGYVIVSKVERTERGMETSGMSARARKYDRAKREGRVHY